MGQLTMIAANWELEDFRVIFGSSTVDYDLEKEDENRAKHKYSLASAIDIFERLLLPLPTTPLCLRDASTQSERRHEHLAVDGDGKVVFIVTTMRQDEIIRVISLRRASQGERELFGALTGFMEAVPA